MLQIITSWAIETSNDWTSKGVFGSKSHQVDSKGEGNGFQDELHFGLFSLIPRDELIFRICSQPFIWFFDNTQDLKATLLWIVYYHC